MKLNLARTLLFSIIAMMSIFLMGTISQHQIAETSNSKQLQKIALNFLDIPQANRAAWHSATISHPELLIRISTRKLVIIPRVDSANKLR